MKPGIHNQNKNAPVALCKLGDRHQGVREAIELCGGLDDLDPAMSVVIKPNLVAWLERYSYAPYGVITSSRVLEEIVKMLKDRGVKEIAIGDGCAENRDFGSTTENLFKGLGYDYFTRKYGVRLVDFNAGELTDLSYGSHALKVNRTVVDCDYLINVPALKTHELCRVTLGFKNLKGCFDTRSKQSCHNPERRVDEYLVHMADNLYPNLTVIDGTYMLANGPMPTGTAQRTELIVASRDMYAADVVGANLLGVPVADVEHLTIFAAAKERSLELGDIEVKGEQVADHARQIPIDTPWSEDGSKPVTFIKQKIEGFDLPFPIGICTGCTYVFPAAMMMILSAAKDSPFDSLELLAKGAEPSGKAKKSFLMGKCPIHALKDDERLQEAIKIGGCPPRLDDIAKALTANGVNVNMAAVDSFYQYLAKRYDKYNWPKEEYWLE